MRLSAVPPAARARESSVLEQVVQRVQPRMCTVVGRIAADSTREIVHVHGFRPPAATVCP